MSLADRFKTTELELAERRERVNDLRLKGLSIVKIAECLEAEGFVNSKSGKPFSGQTIFLDIKYLKSNWQEINAEKYEALRFQLWQEMELVKKEAWAKNDFNNILKSVSQQAKLLGLNIEATNTEINAYLQEAPQLIIEVMAEKKND